MIKGPQASPDLADRVLLKGRTFAEAILAKIEPWQKLWRVHSDYIPESLCPLVLNVDELSWPNGKQLIDVASHYRWGTSVGGDGLQPRALAYLHESRMDELAVIMKFSVLWACLPVQLQLLIIHLLLKQDGGGTAHWSFLYMYSVDFSVASQNIRREMAAGEPCFWTRGHCRPADFVSSVGAGIFGGARGFV